MKMYLHATDDARFNIVSIAREIANVTGIGASRAMQVSKKLAAGRFKDSCPIEFDLLADARTAQLERLCREAGLVLSVEAERRPPEARYPNDAESYSEVAHECWKALQREQALACISKSLELAPTNVASLCVRSTWRSTSPDSKIRDGDQAMADAVKALEAVRKNGGWEHRQCLHVLAAAYAEKGDYRRAVDCQREALGYAITKRASHTIRECLALYKSGRPLRLNRDGRVL